MEANATEAVINALVFGVLWGAFMLFCAKKEWSKRPLKFAFICLAAGIIYILLSSAFKYLIYRYLL